ncbi:uncharacterized protein LOC121466840 [Drosophila elegans]|uniref:uncharacterized protein LOC121466840 n=1 Tax=Drosophila elegans TaxID=30023 RepID=UPI001BC86298|nr:uncharacterized protein LOC121466840 [Drosophila elegans]
MEAIRGDIAVTNWLLLWKFWPSSKTLPRHRHTIKSSRSSITRLSIRKNGEQELHAARHRTKLNRKTRRRAWVWNSLRKVHKGNKKWIWKFGDGNDFKITCKKPFLSKP